MTLTPQRDMSESLEDRLAQVARVLADPPLVHATSAVDPGAPPDGVWGADRACYEFLARHCPPGTRTLETGLGISTVLFALWKCAHLCVTPSTQEREHLSVYLRDRGVDDGDIRIEYGISQNVLPNLEPTPLDVVFIDGCHGFPVPIIDWFYAAGRLREGGIAVIDDLNVPSVTQGLLGFLQGDPRWTLVERGDRWGAWRRETSHRLGEDWNSQPFLGPVTARWGV